MKKCDHCGALNDESTPNCYRCGATVAAVPQPMHVENEAGGGRGTGRAAELLRGSAVAGKPPVPAQQAGAAAASSSTSESEPKKKLAPGDPTGEHCRACGAVFRAAPPGVEPDPACRKCGWNQRDGLRLCPKCRWTVTFHDAENFKWFVAIAVLLSIFPYLLFGILGALGLVAFAIGLAALGARAFIGWQCSHCDGSPITEHLTPEEEKRYQTLRDRFYFLGWGALGLSLLLYVLRFVIRAFAG